MIVSAYGSELSWSKDENKKLCFFMTKYYSDIISDYICDAKAASRSVDYNESYKIIPISLFHR